MITIILYILLGLFGLKLLWNLTIPYELAWRGLRCAGQKSSGITIMPFVEIGLWMLTIGAAALSDGRNWLQSPKNVAVWGGLAIVISYVHLVIAGMIAGWIVSLLKKARA